MKRSDQEIKEFFKGRPGSLKLFNALRKIIEKNGSPDIEIKKTQISFGEKYKYAWIWLPQAWIKKRPEDSITLTILTGKKIDSDRIEESVQPKKGFWTHHIVIEKSKDIDEAIETLINESHQFYLERLAGKSKFKTIKK
jgi:hypothetical protein